MANEEEMVNALETNVGVSVDPWDLATAAIALLKLYPQFEQNKEEYKKFIKKTVENRPEEEVEPNRFLAIVPCPCDPTGTGCHHADCPIGRADVAEHLLMNTQARIDLFIEHIQKETERARQLETANPIATKDVLERLLKKWKEI